VRDSSSLHKKRVIDMMTNLMKDLADIGSSIGSEFKVQWQLVLQNLLFILLPHCQINYHCLCACHLKQLVCKRFT